MRTTFIATSTKSVSAAVFERMQKTIKSIDPNMELCAIDQPGNRIRLYIEMPNNGTQQTPVQRALNQKAAAVIA